MIFRKIEYSVLSHAGISLKIDIWEEDGFIRFSWEYPLFISKKLTQIKNATSNVSVEELNEMISKVRRDIEIVRGEYVMDPSYHQLILFDKDGEEMSYEWSDDDLVPDELQEFLTFVCSILGDTVPFRIF